MSKCILEMGFGICRKPVYILLILYFNYNMYCNINCSGGRTCVPEPTHQFGVESREMYSPESEVESLRNEIAKLRIELVEANEERAQAAEYGLAVLEEKQDIQQQYEDLTSIYESTQRELEVTVSVSATDWGLTWCMS